MACGPFRSPLGGEYQIENINTVIHEVETLRSLGIEISSEALHDGLEQVTERTGLAGRWMITSRSPLTICDTGHNEAGLRHTMHQLQEVWANRRTSADPAATLRMVIGFVNDKDVPHIVRLLPREATFYVTRASVPRAMPAPDLEKILRGHGLQCRLCDSGVADACEMAVSDSKPDDVVYVGGSTFVVADYLASLQ